MANFLAEFRSLCEQRDLTAYNCVNAIQFVLSAFEAQDFEKSRDYLQSALDRHVEADQRISEFHQNQARKQIQSEKGESHGNSGQSAA